MVTDGVVNENLVDDIERTFGIVFLKKAYEVYTFYEELAVIERPPEEEVAPYFEDASVGREACSSMRNETISDSVSISISFSGSATKAWKRLYSSFFMEALR